MAYLRTIRLTSPATEPVTLAEAKAHLLDTPDADDTLITGLISVARARAEQYCNRYFADATAALLFDALPTVTDGPLFIPVPDVQSVDAVTYIDEDNASQAIAGTTFDAEFQFLWPASTWPTSEAQGVRVAVTVGAPEGIEPVKQAMLLFVTDLYEHRGNMTTMQVYDNKAAIALLQPYRVEIGV